MKNFLLCMVLSFFVISCSTDSDFNNSENRNVAEFKNNSKIPENLANPFDAKGKKYYELLKAYLKNNGTPHSIKEVTKQIQFISSKYDSTSSTNKSSISVAPEQITWIMGNPESSLTEIVGISSLGSAAKINLINFLQSLIANNGQEYIAVYNSIVSYESTIVESTTLSEEEKETILTVSSVSRYALYSDSEHKDRDWEISVANRKNQKEFDSYKASIVSVLALFRKFI